MIIRGLLGEKLQLVGTLSVTESIDARLSVKQRIDGTITTKRVIDLEPQEKEVSSAFTDRIVTADAGNYLAKVTVKGMSITRQLNSAGGYTVTVGE